MKIGDISTDNKLILSIRDSSVTVVPIEPTVNRITNPKNYSEFTINGRKKYALLHLVECIDTNTDFTPVISVDKEVCEKILKEYMQNYYGLAIK